MALFKDGVTLMTMTELEEKLGAMQSGKKSQLNTYQPMFGLTSIFARLPFLAQSTILLCQLSTTLSIEQDTSQ